MGVWELCIEAKSCVKLFECDCKGKYEFKSIEEIIKGVAMVMMRCKNCGSDELLKIKI